MPGSSQLILFLQFWTTRGQFLRGGSLAQTEQLGTEMGKMLRNRYATWKNRQNTFSRYVLQEKCRDGDGADGVCVMPRRLATFLNCCFLQIVPIFYIFSWIAMLWILDKPKPSPPTNLDRNVSERASNVVSVTDRCSFTFYDWSQNGESCEYRDGLRLTRYISPAKLIAALQRASEKFSWSQANDSSHERWIVVPRFYTGWHRFACATNGISHAISMWIVIASFLSRS